MRAELTLALDSRLDSLATSSRLKHVRTCSPLVYLQTTLNAVRTSVVMARDRYPAAVFERHGVFLLITGNGRANIGSMGKCMEAGYRLLSGFTTPSRHTSAMSGNAKKDNIFVCELS